MTTTAISFAPLVPSFATIILAVLTVASALCAIYLAFLGFILIMELITGNSYLDLRQKYLNKKLDSDFQKRYDRSERRRQYRSWKKSKGYF